MYHLVWNVLHVNSLYRDWLMSSMQGQGMHRCRNKEGSLSLDPPAENYVFSVL
jgi:hypothetical protein